VDWGPCGLLCRFSREYIGSRCWVFRHLLYTGDLCGLVLVKYAGDRLLDFSGTLLTRAGPGLACTGDGGRGVGVSGHMVIMGGLMPPWDLLRSCRFSITGSLSVSESSGTLGDHGACSGVVCGDNPSCRLAEGVISPCMASVRVVRDIWPSLQGRVLGRWVVYSTVWPSLLSRPRSEAAENRLEIR
jgi:hypothetical protein